MDNTKKINVHSVRQICKMNGNTLNKNETRFENFRFLRWKLAYMHIFFVASTPQH